MIFAVRTTTGRERQVIDKIVALMKKRNIPIYSILNPAELRGYIFVEAETRDDVVQATYGIPHVKGVIEGEISIDEISHFVTPSEQVITLEPGNIVEVISGPFRGEKARVTRVNKLKEEVVVELLEAAVSIPLTMKIDSVRLIRKEEEKEE